MTMKFESSIISKFVTKRKKCTVVVSNDKKYIIKESISNKNSFIRECNYIKEFNKYGIVPKLIYMKLDDIPLFITEYTEGIIVTKRLYSEKSAIIFLLQICSSVKILHDKNYVHCDLKPSNIIFNNGKAILIDMESVTELNKKINFYTKLYSSENNIKIPIAVFDIDFYAIGIILLELLNGQNDVLEHFQNNKNFEILINSIKNVQLRKIVFKLLSQIATEKYVNIDDIIRDLNQLI